MPASRSPHRPYAPWSLALSALLLLAGGCVQEQQGPVVREEHEKAAPPSASFTVTPHAEAHGTFTFDASASSAGSGRIAAYEWDFGDGEVGEGVVVDHAFTRGEYLVELTVTGDSGATAGSSRTVAVGNTPPAALEVVLELDEDGEVDVPLAAVDADRDELGYEITGHPENGELLGEVSETGDLGDPSGLRYRPHADWYGQDSITFRVADGQGGEAHGTVTFEVAPVNDPPRFTSVPVDVAEIGGEYAYEVQAVDPEGDPLELTAPVLPEWLTFTDLGDGRGLLAGSVGRDSGETTLRASDGESRSEQSFMIRHVVAEEPPRITTLYARDVSVRYRARLEVSWSAYDINRDEMSCSIDLGLGGGFEPVPCEGERILDVTHLSPTSSIDIYFLAEDDDGHSGKWFRAKIPAPPCTALTCMYGRGM